LTEPYYADDFVTLYHGNCLEITEWLAADVLVTDPPYGRDWKQGALKRSGSDAHVGIANDGTTAVRDDALALWGTRPAYAFGDLMLEPPAGTKQTLVFVKPPNAGMRGAMNGYRRDLEAVYLIGKWKSGIGGTTSLITTSERTTGNPSSTQGRFEHPHAKPVDVMAKIIERTTGVIADPFAGSGSTLVAAKLLGRRSIGVELDERHCEMAAKRLAQEAFDFGELA
jgi:hypothetical protein